MNEEKQAIQADIDRCRFSFYENRCDDVDRIVPRMREQCTQWQACANRDPAAAAYQTRLTAELIAEVVNSFIDPISYKTLIFAITTTVAFTMLSNLAFYMARTKLPSAESSVSNSMPGGLEAPHHSTTPPPPHSTHIPNTPHTSRRLQFY